VSEIKRVLQGMGEQLTDDEMNAMLDMAKPDDNGNVKYEEFVRDVVANN